MICFYSCWGGHIFFANNHMMMILLLGVLILFVCWLLARDEGGWVFETRVVRGAGFARKIDWRTANLLACPPEVAKKPGFYSCRTNYGDATMLRRDAWGECEVHIHEFNDDIYDKPIKLKNITRLDDLPFTLTIHDVDT